MIVALPLPDADQRPLPLRGGRAAAAKARARPPDRAGAVQARARPEIEELTRQKRVPVLVDGDEVIHDSKRILQYLEWKYPKAEREAAKPKPKRTRRRASRRATRRPDKKGSKKT